MSEQAPGASSAPTTTAKNRMPPLAPGQYDPAQRKAAEEFLLARKEPVFGPFDVLMRSPELMTAARGMGDYLRYKASVGARLSELVILMVARHWSQDFEWYAHAPIAARQGLGTDIIEAISQGRRPPAMSDDEIIVYDFVDELNHHRRVSDPSYDRAVKRFGERGVVDLVGLVGYYGLLAMTMNTARMPIPADAKPLPRFPD